MTNEDLDKATTSFETALRYDARHYKAMFGLGSIACRKEIYDQAEYYFKKAIGINPISSILHCHLGMVLYKQVLFSREKKSVKN